MKQKPRKEYWQFTARSSLEASFKLTAAVFLAAWLWVYHLGGWTITVHHKGEPMFVFKEWW